jgi:tetratricopeptide (TPR) repeat protein
MGLRGLKFVLVVFLFSITSCSGNEDNTLPEFTLSERPFSDELLFDYAGTFLNIEESTLLYLDSLRNLYNTEACIVTFKKLPDNKNIQQLAAAILNNWQIGRAFNGKGLLFVFIESEKQVKFEVAYELEDIFTDAFSGYIEDLQLKPNYRKGNLEIGIIAVFEEIEKRAELKQLGQYSPDEIAELDAELLSGGAGATKKLSEYQDSFSDKQNDLHKLQTQSHKFAETPGKAWEIMLNKWTGGNSYTYIDIYTEAAKMAMGDQNNPNDKRVTDQAKLLLKVPYVVKQDRNVAMIHFNRKKGWEYAPYLFVNDGTGWKFDIVNQRKYVVFGSKGSWHLERGEHGYNKLFDGFNNSFRKDIPYSNDVYYNIAQDQQIAQNIKALEKQFSNDLQPSLNVVLELGRLGVVTARRPQHVYKALNKAKGLSTTAEPYKYLAVYHVMSNFQYESALNEIKEYNKKTESVFGINLQGFLYHKLREYDKAVKAFKESLEIQKSIYALCKLSRAEGMLYVNMSQFDPRRSSHKEKAIEAYISAKEHDPGNWRLPILENWLRHKNILP